METKQIQKGGDKSVNIQYVGLSYPDAKELFNDLFAKNFLELKDQAAEVAFCRVQKMNETFLSMLKTTNPDGIKCATDPDFQFTLYNAQVAYARNGSSGLCDLLVELLIGKSREESASVKSVVLNEAIVVISKLTPKMIDIITINFLLRYSKANCKSIGEFNNFIIYLYSAISPFLGNLSDNEVLYKHIEYSGCGKISVLSISVEKIMRDTYPGFFWKGMQLSEMESIIGNGAAFPELFCCCMNDTTLFQYNAVDNNQLLELSQSFGKNQDEIKRLLEFQKTYMMSDEEIKETLIQYCPNLGDLMRIWNNSSLKSLELTTVGMSIAVANIRAKIQMEFNLSKWIYE